MDLYDANTLDDPLQSEWSRQQLPTALQSIRDYWPTAHNAHQLRGIRRAFYALCTHIDHQLRILIGTLREEGVLDNTIILVCSDHGDMLGDHGLWAKRVFYEGSANVPMILVGPKGDSRVSENHVDPRLVGLQDVMPTLLSLAGIPIPASVEGVSMVADTARQFLFGECKENATATRMAHDGRYKLIWYPAGNHCQLFDLDNDPGEMDNLAARPEHAAVLQSLTRVLVQNAWGEDLHWIRDGQLVGFEPVLKPKSGDRHYGGQRGLHYPAPPTNDPSIAVGSPG
jgi:arylsulfatase